ncbi:CAAX amino terminal protease family protein [Staphylococcus aureus]|uniref:CAAX amino terminal protease family protein n=1 Tax=Staphylococcus aureus TaxID=1280 RepID=A0A2X2KK20_STAAU|nr:CAAX amino terminal protease family protein [Staphylococcus aureus]
MQKFKDLFYDDLSVARGNYFLTLLSAFLITIILLIGFVVSDTHILYGVFIVLIGMCYYGYSKLIYSHLKN